MNDRGQSNAAEDAVGIVVDSFLARFRRGERPALSELVARHPDLAEQLQEIIPALVELEQLGVATGSFSGSRAAGAGSAEGDHAETLGDYRIVRRIGGGGMGLVYEAEHKSLKSRVALKVMHPRFRANDKYLRRFHVEAKAAAGLHHTNIVSVFDYGEQGGVCYYAMQFIEGQPLDRVLADLRRLRVDAPAPISSTVPLSRSSPAIGAPNAPHTVAQRLLTGQFAHAEPPDTASTSIGEFAASQADFHSATEEPAGRDPEPPIEPPSVASSSLGSSVQGRYYREVARIGAQVADALEYAHRAGVLHRDIKPPNLLLDDLGNVWVTDFGLAKLEGGEDSSQSQDLVGTLRYMAPERFRGVSNRSGDVYSLGATLYELVTLRPAFEGDDQPRLIDRIVYEQPERPRKIDHRVPRNLETIVLKALAKDPNDRFRSARELAEELEKFIEGLPIRSRPISTVERSWRWCKRNPAVAALSALAAGLTVFVAIGSTMAAWTFREQRDDVRLEQGKTKASLSRAEHAERDARLAEHEGRLALGQALVSEGSALERTGLIGQRFESLERLGKAAQVLGADPEGRKRLPTIRNQAIAALGLTDLRVRREHDLGDVAVSVDAGLKRYAFGDRSGKVVVRRLDDDRELLRLPAPDQADLGNPHPVFSPDGELLVVAYGRIREGELLRVWHLGRRELLASLSSRGPRAFHPDGRRLFYGAPEGGIGVWDRVERKVVRRLPLDFTPNVVSIDPEGRRLAFNNADSAAPRVAILDLETGRLLADWRSQVGSGSLAWSADGQLLAVGGGGYESRVYVWNVRREALASVLEGHAAMVVGAQFAHTGYLLATTAYDGTTRLWDAAAGHALVTAPGGLLGFAPDDRLMAFFAGGKIGVWDVAHGAECQTLHPRMFGNRSPARDATAAGVIAADMSPDGRLVATSGGDGVRLWDLGTGRELAHVNAGLCETILFDPDGQRLISSGPWGLYRWPIQPDPDRGPDAIRVGPPELLRESEGGAWSKAARMPDHRTWALLDNANAQILLVDSSRPHAARARAAALEHGENHHRMTTVAVSPDGRWLAVGGWYEAGVMVWDLRRGGLDRILRPEDAVGITKFFISFSPDGRWLVSCTHPDAGNASFHFWRVGTWELGLRIVYEGNAASASPPAFTRDGRLMALGIAPDQVLLADASTGRELARLTTLQPVAPTPLVFSPDGTKLVANTNQRTALVWDLRRTRAQLRQLGVDWDAPTYPPDGESSATKPAPIRPVRVIGEVIEPRARAPPNWPRWTDGSPPSPMMPKP